MSNKQKILENEFVKISNYKADELDKNDIDISIDTLNVAYAIAININEYNYQDIKLFTIGDGDVIISLDVTESYTLQIQIYSEYKILIREIKSSKLYINKNTYDINNIMETIKDRISNSNNIYTANNILHE